MEESTPQEQGTDWQSRAMQLQSERDQLEETNAQLTANSGAPTRHWNSTVKHSGSKYPKPPKEPEVEPFSQ